MMDLWGAVADEQRWAHALHAYALSLGGDQVGWFVLARDPQQLVEQGANFAAHPDPEYWLHRPSTSGMPALVGRGITAQATACYATRYREQDPLWDAAMERYAQAPRGGVWVVTDEALPPSHRRRSAAFHNEFLSRHGIGTRMFGGSRGAHHPGGNLFASVYRLRNDEGFTPAQVRRFQREFNAVRHAAFLHRETVALRARVSGLETLMERLSLGMLFFDTGGRLLHANARAHALAQQREHTSLRKLLAGPLQADAAMRALFAQSLRGGSGCAELPGGLVLVALSAGDLTGMGLSHGAPGIAWVLLERSLDAAAAVALARQAYHLSPAEAALLLALMRGQTPQDFADARGVRIRTARTQMSTLLLKTRTQRQQELVALVARLMLLSPGEGVQQQVA
ncbi:helix-turn-helix transcriptional regulator [Melaminivora suipulveris]|uniref:Helix-turn-helix transcriptional regulator n=1 Tax=Melaminivora suipulveris TaxID=2109913 RepID=A0A2R3QH17_9BURK|nr:helix-turn-helix transcriptional regulator [Melaminivora suipulveris]